MKFDKKKVTKILPFIMLGYFANKLSQAFTSADGVNVRLFFVDVANIERSFFWPA